VSGGVVERSIAMLASGALATPLKREEAPRVLVDLHDVEARLRGLGDGLRKPVDRDGGTFSG
jgi:hypothetical protein